MNGFRPDLHDFYYVARKASWEARRKGEPDHPLKVLMGGALVVIGAMMALDAWNKMHGISRTH